MFPTTLTTPLFSNTSHKAPSVFASDLCLPAHTWTYRCLDQGAATEFYNATKQSRFSTRGLLIWIFLPCRTTISHEVYMNVVLLGHRHQNHICLKLVNWFKNSQEPTHTWSRHKKRGAFGNINLCFISCYLMEKAREFHSKSQFLPRLLQNFHACNF